MANLYKNIPTLDLHGYDRDYARICIKEFIDDNHKLRNKYVIIVHGIGSGVLRKTTHNFLKNNKLVKSYKLDNFNSGSTVVELSNFD